ncbi:unnamed protein product [Nippostrongylus brasiliensis]|uniref:Uncharacterized protein n=1 Tax=Nippostrongylus brasiliensis TaxID=27835 RepID=A0A0N4YA03_NIPBR|nr:unnamed protein product [Nippostrongylus brasiliensis]
MRVQSRPRQKPLPSLERAEKGVGTSVTPGDRSADGGKLSQSQDGSMVAWKEAALKNLRPRTIWPPQKELWIETRRQCGTSSNAGTAPSRKKTERLS